MILNLFAYPSNFGKITIYKCDYFGNALSLPRTCLVDKFTVDVEQKNTEDQLLFGGFNQQDYFVLNKRDIRISLDLWFAYDITGTPEPGMDLLFNMSAWSYQGTTAFYKTSLSSVSSTQLTYNELLPYQALGITNSTIQMFKFYLVTETQNVQIFPTSIDTIHGILNYPTASIPPGCWLEVSQYGNINNITPFLTYYEPMFRIDCSEGSFFPCMVDKIFIDIQDDFILLHCDIVSINYNRATRYDFINATSQSAGVKIIQPRSKYKVKIIDFINDITSNFLVTDLNTLEYMNGLITQSFAVTPITNLSIVIENGMTPIYSNINLGMKRTYVTGYYSQNRKINGTMSTLALRSSQPTFDKYPILSGQNNKAMSVHFGNQIFTIPYTIWRPGKVILSQNEYAILQFTWEAITRDRQGQPLFQME